MGGIMLAGRVGIQTTGTASPGIQGLAGAATVPGASPFMPRCVAWVEIAQRHLR